MDVRSEENSDALGFETGLGILDFMNLPLFYGFAKEDHARVWSHTAKFIGSPFMYP